MRRTILVLSMASMLLGCGSDYDLDEQPTQTVGSEAPSAAFCERYAEVRNLGRQEMLMELVDLAPTPYQEAFRRESERAGSLEDTALTNGLFDVCDEMLSGG